MSVRVLAYRLGGAVLVMVLASFLAVSLVSFVPGDAAVSIAGDNATPQQIAEIRTRLGTDQPVVTQYARWMKRAATGDLGRSMTTDRPVWSSITNAAPATLTIAGLAVIFAVLIGVLTGTIAGLRSGTWMDRVANLFFSLGVAIPSFWVGLLLVSYFALDHKWLPATGYAPLSAGVSPWLRHAILPAIALALGTTAEIARQTRSGVVDVMTRPYIRTARAKGISPGRLIRRHVLRNSAIPVVTVLGLQVGRLLGGAVVVEAVFGISGLGTLAVTAVLRRDLPVIQGYILFVAVVVIVVNFLVDLSYSWINPKVTA